MRAILALLALSALVTVPLASAGGEPVPVRCDVDDDLYQHCNVGPVHVVYGPLCAGVAIGQTAPCHDLRDILEKTLA
jgi:hypothetical protein